MTRISLALSIVLLTGLTLVSGGMHGWMSHRWGLPPATRIAAEKLVEFPDRFGSWQLQSAEEMTEETANTLECAGYFVRAYANQDTGESVRVAVLLGPAGPIAVHTPEICYSSRAYAIREERQRVTIQNSDGSDEEFWALTFRSNDLDASLLRVCYAWSTGGPWSAPEDARFTFAGSPYLYKIQLASELAPGTDLQTSDPCERFLQDFVPVAKRYLVEPSGG
jgi:hypothetical protein